MRVLKVLTLAHTELGAKKKGEKRSENKKKEKSKGNYARCEH